MLVPTLISSAKDAKLALHTHAKVLERLEGLIGTQLRSSDVVEGLKHMCSNITQLASLITTAELHSKTTQNPNGGAND